MDKSYTRRIIEEGLEQNPEDVQKYIERLETLFNKTTEEYSVLLSKKDSNPEELEMLKQECGMIFENLGFIEKIIGNSKRERIH